MNNLAVVVLVLGLIAFVVFLSWRSRARVSASTKKILDGNARVRADLESAIEQAGKVVAAYGEVLEKGGQLCGVFVRSQADLPYTKAEIREAIELLLHLPIDDIRRNNLEVGDTLLNNFIPDGEYRIVHQQREGFSKALKILPTYQVGEVDKPQLIKIACDGTTQEGESRLRQVEERVYREGLLRLEFHKAIRRKAEHFQDS